MGNHAIVIPIASGKGGVGKSFLAANLSMALARLGKQTIAVDMDLGGSNLHSFLGLSNTNPGLGEFLKASGIGLSQLLVQTAVPHLSFLPGDGKTPFTSNITWHQKNQLITDIMGLTADFIILDLGAGTTLNTLDFFAIAPTGIVVTIADYPTVMNLQAFLKNFILRLIERETCKSYEAREVFHSMINRPMPEQDLTISKLQNEIDKVDPEAGQHIITLCREYRPRIVFNQGHHPQELKVGEHIQANMERFLTLEVEFIGFLFDDPAVRDSVKTRTAFLDVYPNSMAAQGVIKIAERVIRFGNSPIAKSLERLTEHTWKVFKTQANSSVEDNQPGR